MTTRPHPSGDDHWTRRTPERVLRGTDSHAAKLTDYEICELCAAFDQGAKKSELARQYEVSRITIWRHIKAREV